MKKQVSAPSSIPLGIPDELPNPELPNPELPIGGAPGVGKRPARAQFLPKDTRSKNTRPSKAYSAKLKGEAVPVDASRFGIDPGHDVRFEQGVETEQAIDRPAHGVQLAVTGRAADQNVEQQNVEQPARAHDDVLEDGELSKAEAAFDPAAVWKMVLSELAMQMPPSTYDTWVRDTVVLGYEDGEFIIGLPNAYARDWAENRLRHSIKRTLSSILQRAVEVRFRIRPKEQLSQEFGEDLGDAPLYRQPARDAEGADLDARRSLGREARSQSGAETRTGAGNSPGTGIETAAEQNGQTGTNARKKSPSAMQKPATEKPVQGTTRRPSAFRIEENGAMHSLQEQPQEVPNLNPHHTFDTFVVGNHNRLAHAAALAIVDAPGQTFNPLFIYGGVGLGKTHLLHSIGNSMGARGLKLLYCSSEQFTNDLISAIRTQTTEEFRNKYRQVDILLIDDIQFIAGKETTQEEFFHTFNHLHAAGRQVVLSSDRPPKALPLLEERLRSRFEGGLQTDIAQPDFETRVAILQSKGNRMGIPVPYEVLLLVAERVDSNIRELEGALNRLFMQARLADCAITLGFAQTILEDLSPHRSPCAPGELVRIVAEHFGLRADDLTGRKRTKEIANARQIAMYLLREEHDLSLPAIGGHLGGRDHSTVRYGVGSVVDELKNDEALRMTIMTLREKIYAPTA